MGFTSTSSSSTTSGVGVVVTSLGVVALGFEPRFRVTYSRLLGVVLWLLGEQQASGIEQSFVEENAQD
jgi:hypothetical protein